MLRRSNKLIDTFILYFLSFHCATFAVQVLAESEQIRREADDIGPRAELDHWKKRTSKFNFLLEQIKGNHVKAVLGVLQAAKSKSLKVIVILELT